MAEDEKDGLEQGARNSYGHEVIRRPQALSLEEKERLLDEMQKTLDRWAQGGGAAKCDPDSSFSNFSFGLGIDPNG